MWGEGESTMVRLVRPHLIIVAALVVLACGFEARATTASEALTVYVFGPDKGIIGSDGQPHEAFVSSSLVVKVGTPARLTFVNYRPR